MQKHIVFLVLLLIGISSCVQTKNNRYQLSAKGGDNGFDAIVVDNETNKIYFIEPYTTVLEIDLKERTKRSIELKWLSEIK